MTPQDYNHFKHEFENLRKMYMRTINPKCAGLACSAVLYCEQLLDNYWRYLQSINQVENGGQDYARKD